MPAVWSDKYNGYLYDADYMQRTRNKGHRNYTCNDSIKRDQVISFVDAKLEYCSNGGMLSAHILYNAYLKYCEENGIENQVTRITFVTIMKNYVVMREHIKGIRYSSQMNTPTEDGSLIKYYITCFHNIKFK